VTTENSVALLAYLLNHPICLQFVGSFSFLEEDEKKKKNKNVSLPKHARSCITIH